MLRRNRFSRRGWRMSMPSGIRMTMGSAVAACRWRPVPLSHAVRRAFLRDGRGDRAERRRRRAANACFTCHGLDGTAPVPDAAARGTRRRLSRAPAQRYATAARSSADGVDRAAPRPHRASRVAIISAGVPFAGTSRPRSLRRAALPSWRRSARHSACASCLAAIAKACPGQSAARRAPALYIASQLDEWRKSRRRNDLMTSCFDQPASVPCREGFVARYAALCLAALLVRI